MTIQDWGVTYDELEPHYDAFEYLCGTSRHRRQSEGPDPGRRQSVRRAALAALSQPGAEAGLRPHAVRQGRARARLQAVPAAVRQHVAGLHQSARRAHGAVHLLRLLRMVRLRQLFQGQPADDDPAGAGPQVEFLRARQFRGHAHQHSTAPASAPPASPSSTPAARNGSSRPIS